MGVPCGLPNANNGGMHTCGKPTGAALLQAMHVCQGDRESPAGCCSQLPAVPFTFHKQRSCLVSVHLPDNLKTVLTVKEAKQVLCRAMLFAGQHVAMAVEGAYHVALQLGRHGFTPRALRAYEDSRVNHLQRVADIEWASLLSKKPLP